MLIYAAKSPSGKVYVGQTTDTLARRKSAHFAHKTKTPFANALRKYGDKMEWRIVDTADSIAELNRLEVKWIAKLNALAPCGYNLRAGGRNGKHTAATRRQMAASQTGRRHSAETIAKMRAAKLGKKRPSPTAATRAKLAAAQLGKPKTPAHCAAISAGRIGIAPWNKAAI